MEKEKQPKRSIYYVSASIHIKKIMDKYSTLFNVKLRFPLNSQ